ncbi:MAG: hypothetical protein AAGH46_02565 [Bacteroidota bacterium]
MRIYLVFIVALLNWNLFSHSPYEIAFKLDIKSDGSGVINMQLTSQTIFDLIHDQIPELSGHSALKLTDYKSFYQDYFNRVINLQVNGEKVDLRIQNMDLTRHDSFINFYFLSRDEVPKNLEFSVKGFEFYHSPKFFLKITNDGKGVGIYRLSKNEPSCSLSFDEIVNAKESFNSKWIYPLVFFLIVILPFFWRKLNLENKALINEVP